MTPAEALARIRRVMPLAQLRLQLGGPSEALIWSAAVVVIPPRGPARERVARQAAGATQEAAIGRLLELVEGG